MRDTVEFGRGLAIVIALVGRGRGNKDQAHGRREVTMRYLKYIALFGLMVVFAGAMASTASAQVRVGVGIGIGPAYVGVGAAPVCAYGYYGYYPYACAPVGYYGPRWFVNGVFIGAGPWFHGFYGRPGFVGRPFPGGYWHGGAFVGRGPVAVGHGPVYAGRGGFVRGGTVVRGRVGGFHGGAVMRGGGFHGGGRR
jgi:hypothetical protein